jgi:hypothetical protein
MTSKLPSTTILSLFGQLKSLFQQPFTSKTQPEITKIISQLKLQLAQASALLPGVGGQLEQVARNQTSRLPRYPSLNTQFFTR